MSVLSHVTNRECLYFQGFVVATRKNNSVEKGFSQESIKAIVGTIKSCVYSEVAKGKSSQNRDYVFKVGKWLNDSKGETNLHAENIKTFCVMFLLLMYMVRLEVERHVL